MDIIRPLFWMGSSKKDLLRLPEQVVDSVMPVSWKSFAVLHVFQKKSKAGVATPAVDAAMIRERLKLASELRRSRAK